MANLSISVAEFIQSGQLTYSHLVLQQEHKSAPQAGAPSPSAASGGTAGEDAGNINTSISINVNDGRGKKSQQQIILENAARVALLLTRSFIDFCELSGIGHDDVHMPYPFELDDFFIELDQGQGKTNVSEGLSSDKSSNGGLQQIIIIGIDNRPPTRIPYPQKGKRNQPDPKTSPMQVLGKLLYYVFSQGTPLLSDIVQEIRPLSPFRQDVTSVFTSNDRYVSGQSYGSEPSSKSLRTSEISIFTRLTETEVFPVSINHFLSDMIDIGSRSTADCSAFTSFQDITQDLEQMIAEPLTFLLNDPHFLQGELPVFGQRHFGRKEEVARVMKVTTEMEESLYKTSAECQQVGVEAVFISGIAGSGKSHLVHVVEDTVSRSGWIVIKAKFERGIEHASRRIVSSMFDELIVHLSKMKKGGKPSDAVYIERVSKFILLAIGDDGLSSLVGFLPSLPLLFDGLVCNEQTQMHAEDANWQMIYSLSKILEAVLEQDRFVMICCDDLQWADSTSLALISEVLMNVGSSKLASRHCLFVGSYRDDEVDDNHPFSIQYFSLQTSSYVNTTELKLSQIFKETVIDMIMTDLRLPRRLVLELADAVYKKTSGHAIFVVELLNSLVRDSIIAYSSQQCRYDWDQDRINFIQTGDTVAGLIASNLSSLSQASQRALQILSCFGTQTDLPLLQILEQFENGILSSLDTFVEKGILDRAGPIVIFTHDLIQQGAYEGMPLDERHKLHLEIGLFLGSISSIDCSPAVEPVTTGIDQLQLNDSTFFVGKSMTSSLLSLACDQINAAGPTSVSDEEQVQKIARWNLSAGQKSSQQSNFRAALYYFSKGIAFFRGDRWWLTSPELCLKLHEGAVVASFALGEIDNVTRYADKIEGNVPFLDTLKIQQVVLKSLAQSGKHEECICKGIEILRLLDFDVPLSPTMESICGAMNSVDSIACQYSIDDIMSLCESQVDESIKSIVQIIVAFYVSCFSFHSPFLPLIACVVVKYSLENGICEESTIAFATFSMFKIVQGDYAEGQKWAQVTRGITKKYQSMKKSNVLSKIQSGFLLSSIVDIWFDSPREISNSLLKHHHDAMRKGHMDMAMHSLVEVWTFRLLGGDNLSVISLSTQNHLKLVAKHGKHFALYVALNNVLLMELTGKSLDCFSEFEGSICNMNDLQAEAENTKDNHLLQTIHAYNVMLAYWRGDYLAVETSSRISSMLPTEVPQLFLVTFTLLRGLAAFHLYRKIGGDERLAEGKDMMIEMEKWAQNSNAVFENKLLLLKAEYFASTNEDDKALNMYMQSVQISRDHGNIHELGLVYESLGNYHSACVSREDPNVYFKMAHLYYTQWGATAVAEKLVREHVLDMTSSDNKELQTTDFKILRRVTQS